MLDPALSDLPGFELVERGLRDLAAGRETVEALVVAVGATRLRAAGVAVPPAPADPEDRLYEALARTAGDDAHGRYNALVRRLVRFERAVECASR